MLPPNRVTSVLLHLARIATTPVATILHSGSIGTTLLVSITVTISTVSTVPPLRHLHWGIWWWSAALALGGMQLIWALLIIATQIQALWTKSRVHFLACLQDHGAPPLILAAPLHVGWAALGVRMRTSPILFA